MSRSTTTKTVGPGLSLERKTAGDSAGVGLLSADDRTGVVETIVSVTGIVDDVNDLIEPGAYTESLVKRRPKGVFAHDWTKWVSRTEDVKELQPRDPVLIQYAQEHKEKTGRDFPAEAGALYVKTRFNLETKDGQDAYSNVKFFDGDCEWSIGYQVPKGGSKRGADGVRRIKKLDLYEYSPVLFGANSKTMTLSVKHASFNDQGDVEVEADLETENEDGDEGAGAEGAGAAAEGGTGDEPDLAQLHQEAAGATLDAAAAEGADHIPAEGAEVQGEQEGAGQAADLEDGATSEEEEEDGPGEGEQGAAGEEKRFIPPAKREALAKRDAAMPDGSYPIENIKDLQNAIKAWGRSKPEDRDKIKAHIVARARALKAENMLPDSWKVGKKDGAPGVADTPSDEAAVARLKAWYIRGEGAAKIRWGQKGDFERCVRIAGKHMPPEKVKGFCANVHHDALGVWPGREHGKGEHGKKVLLPGSLEELRDAVTTAVTDQLTGMPVQGKAAAPEWPTITPDTDSESAWLVAVHGTYPNRVVASRYDLKDGRAEAYEVPFRVADGVVQLGDPQPVALVLEAEGADGSVLPGDLVDLGGCLEDALLLAKTLLHSPGAQTKAGRVLSTRNTDRVRVAVENLIAVLRASGVDVGKPQEAEDKPEKISDTAENDSTAPSARPQVKSGQPDTVVISAEELAAGRALTEVARQSGTRP